MNGETCRCRCFRSPSLSPHRDQGPCLCDGSSVSEKMESGQKEWMQQPVRRGPAAREMPGNYQRRAVSAEKGDVKQRGKRNQGKDCREQQEMSC
jgi:hypothetical protein